MATSSTARLLRFLGGTETIGAGGIRFRVVSCGNSGKVRLNGKVIEGAKISHEDIMRGGTLAFGNDAVR